MSANPQPNYEMTEKEYLKFEHESDSKHEFVNGKIYAMAGASWNHTVIVSNMNTRLNVKLVNSPCISVTNDIQLQVVSEKAYRYPDVVVVCGEPQFKDPDANVDMLTNPIVLAEIMSPSTALVDRNEKLYEYFRIPTLQEYLIISQDRARVERFLRDAENDEWRYVERVGLDKEITLPSLDCTLLLSEIYNQVTFKSSDN